MPRQFKFRVWDIQDKCFCYISDLKFFTGDSQSRMLDGIPRYVGTLKSSGYDFYKQGKHTHPIYDFTNLDRQPAYVIQQWSGVKDKNNKDIYEGDFLKDFEFPVEFNDGSFIVTSCYDLTQVPLRELDISNITIVGNIFENPELNHNT